MKTIVVFTGAGISAESNIKTFRDSDGLWEQYKVEDVATPQAWEKDYKMVLEFYDQRRKQVIEAKPNAAHYAIAKLETKYKVYVITQNIDDLHERAGSKNVLHLHGEIRKSRSVVDPQLKYDIEGYELKPGQLCRYGKQLRPDVVWFGEDVPMMTKAYKILELVDYLIIIGTSLNVYPAANIIYMVPDEIPKIIIDPKAVNTHNVKNLRTIKKKAGEAVPEVVDELVKNEGK